MQQPRLAHELLEHLGPLPEARDDLRVAVTTLEEIVRTAQRVFGSAHPVTRGIEITLQKARAALRARETPSGSA